MEELERKRLAELQADPDTGPIQRGHVCKHMIRWPHECRGCFELAMERHNLEELLSNSAKELDENPTI